MSSLWYMRYWLSYRNSKKRFSQLLDTSKPALVVGDEEFSIVTAALDRGLPTLMITDELQLGFGRTNLSRRIESRVSIWYEGIQRRVDWLIVPEFGEDIKNLRYVGPIVRARTADREHTLMSLGLPTDRRLVLVSLSGSGVGRFLVKRVFRALETAGQRDAILVVAGGKDSTNRKGRLLEVGVLRDNQNLVAAVDLCISLAGKSTMDEALCFGTPIIAIPLKGHFEQEKNSQALGFTHEDLERLEELIPKHLGHRLPPRSYNGAMLTADLITNAL